MTSLEKRYVDYYTPLVQDFVREASELEHPEVPGLPEPFLPAFGPQYEKSAMRLVVIGRDTRGWGDIRTFLEAERLKPGIKVRETIEYFAKKPFTEWGSRESHFWGFAMMLLGVLHGREDWGAMRHDEFSGILDSFAWGNTNAVELYGSCEPTTKVSRAYWEAVRKAGEPLNRFRHLVETMCPRVAILMNRQMNFPAYFEGYSPEERYRDGRFVHYYLPEADVNVFHVPHPGSMNRIEGTDEFRDRLKEIMVRNGFAAEFPEFLSDSNDHLPVIDWLLRNSPPREPGFNKFDFVSWVAEELAKRQTFMSVTTLIGLLNARGETTNRGAPFVPENQGPYKLVSATYHRFEGLGTAEGERRAHNIAIAFRKPNFEYAYSAE